MDKEYVGIRQATAKGYIECEIGGVADFSYPKGEELFAIDRGNFYELRKPNGWGTMAPKECEGNCFAERSETQCTLRCGGYQGNL